MSQDVITQVELMKLQVKDQVKPQVVELMKPQVMDQVKPQVVELMKP